MSGVLRHFQQPEWSARALWDFASSVLAKTYEYNPSADDWRLLRPTDIPGLPTAPMLVLQPFATGWELQVGLGAAAWTSFIPAFRVPQGIGIGFYGFWFSGVDLGIGSGYRIQINAVTRVICPMHEFMSDSKGANKLILNTGFIIWFHIHYIHLEQLIFARENDVLNIQLYNPGVAVAINTLEVFPLAVISGNSKQLLINA